MRRNGILVMRKRWVATLGVNVALTEQPQAMEMCDMLQVSKYVLAVLMITCLLTLTACGPKSTKVQDSTILADTSGLELDASQAPTLVYTRPGAPSLAAYNRFIIDPVQVNYRDPNIKEIQPEDIGRMQQEFRDAMIKELGDAGYEVGTRSQAETLRVSLTVLGLRAPSAAGNVSNLFLPFSVSVGEVTIEGVFRDALTNRIDAVVVDRSKGSRMFKAAPWSTWADIRATFNQWARGFRKAVDKAHGR